MLLYVEVNAMKNFEHGYENIYINQKDMFCPILSTVCFHSGCRTFKSVLRSLRFIVRNYYYVNEAYFVAV